ncbi:hypothetical protein Tco_0267817 [Tanacetum coccineum]
MNDPNITMEEYIRLEEEKALSRGETFNWQTATFGRIRHYYKEERFTNFEEEFPAIVFRKIKGLHTALAKARIARTSSNFSAGPCLIMESLVKKKQKGAILELKRRHLKNTIFCTYTPYPAMKIRRISASSAQETRNDQFPIRRIHYNQYAVCTAVHQYGISQKNHKKIVKSEQTRRHENQKSSKRSQRYKAEARKVKPQSNPVKEKPIIGQ